MASISLLVVHITKMCLALSIGASMLYPPKLIHRQFSPVGLAKNQSFCILTRVNCRIPLSNVELTNKDVTDALYLPPDTLLIGNLHAMGKCKASMDKLGVSSSSDCFCLGFWFVYLVGTTAIFSSVFNLSDALWVMRKSSPFFTNAECDSGKKHAKFSFVFFFSVLVLMFFHVNYLSESMRYTLPGDVYDSAYFETPLTWWFVLGFCTISVFLVCPIQMAILSNAQKHKTYEARNKDISPTDCSVTIKVDNRSSDVPSYQPEMSLSEAEIRSTEVDDSYPKLPPCSPPSPASTPSYENVPTSDKSKMSKK